MRIQVDAGRCQGHNRCMIFAPEVFEVDDYGFAAVQGPDGEVPPEYQEKARAAMDNCPELAIVLLSD